jgi:ABC-type sulfate/molybdate transport systems ATPase subunit
MTLSERRKLGNAWTPARSCAAACESHDRSGLATVVVTHDQDEAMGLADLVVMSMGRIEQIGTPSIRTRPATRFVSA